MTYAVSLYDALTGINVPKDRALAVVEALERKMTSELATKSDLEQLRLATKADIEQLRLATKGDIEQLKLATKADIEHLRSETKADIEHLRSENKAEFSAVRSEISALRSGIDALSLKITVRLGGIVIASSGLLFAALQSGLGR